MRTIKFRGKDVTTGKWVYGYYVRMSNPFTECHCIITNREINYNNPRLVTVDDLLFTTINPDTIGQFTGLCDKNGKEIYEGDIVMHPYVDPIFRDLVESKDGEGVTSEVVFHDAAFVVKYDVNDFIYLDGFTRHGHIEVIGNIYDNPELINK